jgi:hypothetical protein
MASIGYVPDPDARSQRLRGTAGAARTRPGQTLSRRCRRPPREWQPLGLVSVRFLNRVPKHPVMADRVRCTGPPATAERRVCAACSGNAQPDSGRFCIGLVPRGSDRLTTGLGAQFRPGTLRARAK